MSGIVGALIAMGFFRSGRDSRSSSTHSQSPVTKREKIIPKIAYWAIKNEIELDDVLKLVEMAAKKSYFYKNDSAYARHGKDFSIEFPKWYIKSFLICAPHEDEHDQRKYGDNVIKSIEYDIYSDYTVLSFHISENDITDLVFLDYFDLYLQPILFVRKVTNQEDDEQ